eukprot:g3717.t1
MGRGSPRTVRRALVFCTSFAAASLFLFFLQGFHRPRRSSVNRRVEEAVAALGGLEGDGPTRTANERLRSEAMQYPLGGSTSAATDRVISEPHPVDQDSGSAARLPVVRFTLNNLDGRPGARGDVDIEVHSRWAPLGSARFMELVEADFFREVRFFRVIPGFMAQFGIHGEPDISSTWAKKRIQDDPVLESNARGYISFATSGKNTRTTQLFINFVDNKRLDSMGFSPFAKVVRGMDVVDRIFKIGEKPDQQRIQSGGNDYLESHFPQLTYIESLRVLDGDDRADVTRPILLSSGCTATADARGNLGPASVVTSSNNDDWLKDRHQFASDMNGTPIPGKHWIQIDLHNDALMPGDLTSAQLDWETAYAEAYVFECAPTSSGPYERREEESRRRVSPSAKGHVIDDIHFKPVDGEAGCRYVRLAIEHPATRWGASLYEIKIFGRGTPKCSSSTVSGTDKASRLNS